MYRVFIVLAVVGGCDDGSVSDAPHQDAGVDAAVAPGDLGPDATRRDAARDGSAPDAAGDARPDGRADATQPADLGADLGPDAAPLPIEPPEALPVEAPRHLAPGETVEWAVAARPESGLQLQLRAWRTEDAVFEVSVAGEPRTARVLADGDGGWRWLRAVESEGYGVVRPPVLRLPAGDVPTQVRLTSVHGGGVLSGARVADVREALPQAPPPDPAEGTVVAVQPCGDDCDDAPLVAAAMDAVEGPLVVEFEGRFTFRTPLVVRRADVVLRGGTVVWDPTEDLVWGQPIRFEGGGPGVAAHLVGDHVDGARRFTVDAPEGWAPRYVSFTADDFGEVPPVCVNGRDVERFNRHILQLLRVEAIERDDAGTHVVTDREVNLGVPAAANPRLVAVDLLEGARVEGMQLLGACPQALEHERFGAPECDNAGIVDDRGLVFAWTVGATAERVRAQAFGKEAIVVDRSLDTRVVDCEMDHPARYGSGGQGYGVHAIRSSRTLVRGERVDTARHGVVVDFGSSDSQVLDGEFSNMNQALVDVHGEASRDTLVRGNRMTGGLLGVIIGGGGREVHCNDGPRHTVEYNHLRDCPLAAVSVSDYTRGVTVRGNDLRGGAVLLAAAFGAGDIVASRNRFGPSDAITVNVLAADTGGILLRDNLFEARCDAASAVLVGAGAEAPEFRDNVWCPEE